MGHGKWHDFPATSSKTNYDVSYIKMIFRDQLSQLHNQNLIELPPKSGLNHIWYGDEYSVVKKQGEMFFFETW